MRTAAANELDSAGRPPGGEALRALTQRRIRELQRLLQIGMERARQLKTVSDLLPPEVQFKLLTGNSGAIAEFDRVARAIRRIVVLEMELVGLFEAPDREGLRRLKLSKPGALWDGSERPERALEPAERSDLGDRGHHENLNDPSDYQKGPMEEVVAGVRKVLKAEAPEDDPFAPPPEQRTADAEESKPAKPDEHEPPAQPVAAQTERKGATAKKPAVPARGSGTPAKAWHPAAAPSWSRRRHRSRGPPG